MRLCKSRHERPQVVLGEPFGQAPLQDTVPAAPNAGDHNHRARAPRVRRAKEARQRSAARVLVMPVQIQRAADFDPAAANALLRAAVLRLR